MARRIAANMEDIQLGVDDLQQSTPALATVADMDGIAKSLNIIQIHDNIVVHSAAANVGKSDEVKKM